MTKGKRQGIRVVLAMTLGMLAGVAFAQGGTGLKGEYFNSGGGAPDRDTAFAEAPTYTRLDAAIDFGFTSPPAPNTPADGFAVRWTGQILPLHSEDTLICGATDDGARIWLQADPIDPANPPDAALVVDAWVDRGETESCSEPIPLVAGKKYNILYEMYENGGGEAARLRWSSASQPKQIIPSTQLFPPPSADATPPGVVTDLKVLGSTGDTVSLSFVAPGDDGSTGTAFEYDLRYSLIPINEANFSSSTLVSTVKPAVAGTVQTIDVQNLQALQTYYFAIRAVDDALNAGPVSESVQASTTSASPPANGVLVENYLGIVSTCPDALRAAPKYPNAPDETYFQGPGTFLETKVNAGDNYGQRVRGYILPPKTGGYTFLFASDDGGELWLSTDETPEKLVKIAEVPNCGWAAVHEFTKYPEQTSEPITLTAGNRYYFEAIQQENGGGDNLAVAWITPDGGDEAVIPAEFLAPFVPKETKGRATGMVIDPEGKPVAGAQVGLTPAGGNAYVFSTNAQGIYSGMVPEGSYTVAGKAPTNWGIIGEVGLSAPISVTGGRVTNIPATTVKPMSLPAFPSIAAADKAVYFDDSAGTAWIAADVAATVRDYFVGKGYKELDAAALAAFMTDHIASKTPSVIVSAQDVLPDTVIDMTSGGVVKSNLFNDYLNAGGRFLHMGDIPFYYVSQDGTNYTAADNGSTTILGFSAGAGTRDTNDTIVWTPLGQKLGFTATWPSQRPSLVSDVDVILAKSAGGATSWIKLYPDLKSTGMFMRLMDTGGQNLTEEVLADAQKLAELSGVLPLPDVTPGKPGDLNDDGKINVQDATLSLRIAVGLLTPTDAQKAAGDVNNDGKLNIQDTTLILQVAVGNKPESDLK